MNEHRFFTEVTYKEEIILYVLYGKQLYGREVQTAIIDASGGTRQILPGGLYSMLRSLKAKGLVESIEPSSELEGTKEGRRIYYKLTDKGDRALDEIKLFRFKLFAWKTER